MLTFDHIVDWGLLLSGIPLCLLSRAANIFPLARLANMARRVKVPFNLQVRLRQAAHPLWQLTWTSMRVWTMSPPALPLTASLDTHTMHG